MEQTFRVLIEVTREDGDPLPADRLHELLCTAIHEGDESAMAILNANVSDIGFPELTDESIPKEV